MMLRSTTALALAMVLCACGSETFVKRPPNVILVLVDDQGWTGTSVEMIPGRSDTRSDYYRTPNLDRLAAAGMRFSQAYAAASLCSPSRASIQTGKSPARLHMTDTIAAADKASARYRAYYEGKPLRPPVPRGALSHAETTIAELIETSRPGVTTAHFGKWHIGPEGPTAHGYDVGDGPTMNIDGVVQPPNPKDTFGITRRARDFLRRQVENRSPFFLQLSYYAVHKPLIALPATVENCRVRAKGERHFFPLHAAMTEDLDTALGLLLDDLDELGIADETYVIYTSDNGAYMDGAPSHPQGPVTTNLPLARGKCHLWEGGIRVPFIVRGPGIAAGSHCATPVIAWDLLPTLRELFELDAPLPTDVEGGSLAGLLRGGGKGEVERPRDALVWHFPHYVDKKGAKPHSAIRRGSLKLIRSDEEVEVRLHDLDRDLGETRNLASERLEETAALLRELDATLDHVEAARVRRPH